MAGTVSDEDIRNLIRIFDASDWQELHVELPGLKLTVSKTGAGAPTSRSAPVPPAAAPPAAVAAATQPAPVLQAALAIGPGQKMIHAPNLGSFWRQPKPGAPPYVEIGQTVEADTTVCLIEVMKLFTPVKAGINGRIVRVCAEDGQMVEYDDPLFVIDPA
jgi:acetyl-CoA carboxylase biotin carboxyl carrier protein